MRFLKSISGLTAFCWVSSVLVMGFLFAAFFAHAKLSDYHARLEVSKRLFAEYRKDVLKGEVGLASKLARREYALRLDELSSNSGLHASASIRKDVAAKATLSRLAAYRLGRSEEGDVFIVDHYGAKLLAPSSGAASDLSSLNGQTYRRFLEGARRPEGAFALLTPRRGEAPALFYGVRLDEPAWIVCASLSDSQLAPEAAEGVAALKAKLIVDLTFIIVAAFAVVFAALWLSWGVSVMVRKELDRLVAFCKGSSVERERLSEDEFRFSEFKIVAASLSGLVRSVGSLVGTVKELALRSESGNQEKRGFIASVCKEFSTPLNSIISMTRILKDSHLDRAQRECVDAIDVSAQALARISSELKDFSVDEEGRLRLVERPFDPLRMVEDLLVRMEPLAKDAGDELLFKRPDYPLPPLLKGDGGKIAQVLQTLIANALKFTKGGKVEVGLSLEGQSLDGRPLFSFKVSDDGLGISMEKLKRIFDVSGDTVGGRFGGVGLGLAVAKGMVEAMGGSISASSEKGKGSSFSFRVPLARIDTSSN